LIGRIFVSRPTPAPVVGVSSCLFVHHLTFRRNYRQGNGECE
jgi:hypothetical protein